MKTKQTADTARISSPADVVGVIPAILGFHPSESVVVLCLHMPTNRAGLVMRVDLPQPRDSEPFAAEMAARVGRENADAVVVVCYTEEGDSSGELPRRHLIDQFLDELFLRDIGCTEALLVRADRWWSYTCHRPCCPDSGTPLPTTPTGAAVAIQAERALAGAAVLPGREALEASVEGPAGARKVSLEQRFAAACAQLSEEVGQRGAAAVRRDSLAAVTEMRDRFMRGDRELDDADAVRVLAGLEDKWVRDALVTWGLDQRGDEIQAFLTVLAQHAVDDSCAAICTVVAAVAYQQGHGALALVALQRALRAEPEYQFALLLDSLLDAQVNPREIRAMAQRVRRELVDRGIVQEANATPV
ncbi:DUF4192 domain-containing protein [Phytoactinopolyspora halotolerans]|uniref:DUF4192 domain-containing protein n=1 Tax=Phytoactinopolyspora halotolerans TaxID=1981512 RepID=A0A6L9S4R3_9ACTN|nr:DUF4192 domain-containing protein [Phytoactinopolyspora halotolerans]NED99497.1 DUF4192 domain-containing protein [Phytoactinopolyspora halotolerans]